MSSLPEKKTPIKSIEELQSSEFYKNAQKPESEEKINSGFSKLITQIMHFPIASTVILMFRYFNDEEIPKNKKILIATGLLYFVTPIDFIPDSIPILGLLDDIGVLSMVASYMMDELSEYRRKINQNLIH